MNEFTITTSTVTTRKTKSISNPKICHLRGMFKEIHSRENIRHKNNYVLMKHILLKLFDIETNSVVKKPFFI